MRGAYGIVAPPLGVREGINTSLSGHQTLTLALTLTLTLTLT